MAVTANSTPVPSRRAFFGSAIAAGAMVAQLPVIPALADAALFALESPIMAALAAREPLCRAHNAADLLAIRSPTEDNRRARDEAEAAYENADSVVLDLTRDLAGLRATTLAGLILKARMIKNDGDDEALSESIVADLLAMDATP